MNAVIKCHWTLKRPLKLVNTFFKLQEAAADSAALCARLSVSIILFTVNAQRQMCIVRVTVHPIYGLVSAFMVHVHTETSRIGKPPRMPPALQLLVKMQPALWFQGLVFLLVFLCRTAALFIPTVLLFLLNPFRWVLDLWEFLQVLGGLKFNESFTSQINHHSLSLPFPPSLYHFLLQTHSLYLAGPTSPRPWYSPDVSELKQTNSQERIGQIPSTHSENSESSKLRTKGTLNFFFY